MRSLLFLILFFAAGLANSQTMYVEDLLQLSGSVRSLMARAERVPTSDGAGILAIQRESIEVHKKLNRIWEEAASANLELMRSGNRGDRHLLLVSGTAESLNFARAMTLSFLETRDSVFWTAALGGVATAKNLQAAIR